MVAIIFSFMHNNEASINDSKQSEELNKLYSEYSHIEYKIKYNESKINSLLPEEAGIFFLFDQLTDNLTDTVKPLLDKAGYIGVVVITNTRMPGMENTISEENFTELIESGWEIAIGFEPGFQFSASADDANEQLESYIDEIKNNDFIKENDFEISTVVFSSVYTQYRTDFDKVLNENAINTVISHRSLEYNPNDYFTSESRMLKLDCIEFNMSNTIQSNLTDKISGKQPIAIISKLVENDPLNNHDVSVQKYQKLIEFISEYDTNEPTDSKSKTNTTPDEKKTIYLGSLSEFYRKKLEEYSDNQHKITVIIEEIEKDKETLKELDEKINDIIKQNQYDQ